MQGLNKWRKVVSALDFISEDREIETDAPATGDCSDRLAFKSFIADTTEARGSQRLNGPIGLTNWLWEKVLRNYSFRDAPENCARLA
jgi:hypothetical protein